MKSRWWSQPSEQLQDFAKWVASFHVPTAKEPTAEQLKHRAEHSAAILKTASDLRKLTASFPSKQRNSLCNAIFKRPYARRAAVMISAYSRRNQTERLSMKQIIDRATLCERTHSLSEEIKYNPVAKNDDSTRDTWMFGPVRYAQQILLGWLIDASMTPPANDFSYPGQGGINGAAMEIGSALLAGQRFWITTDIKSAYPSITPEHFRKVFPEVGKCLERYVAFPTLPYNKTTSAIDAPRRELPQGAAHSSLILSAVIDGCLADLSLGNVVVVVYADNIAIGAQTVSEAKCAYFAIKKALAQTPSGLELHACYLCDGFQHATCESPTLVEGFSFVNSLEFCGYRISKDAYTSELRFRPSAKAWKKFWSNFGKHHFSTHWTMEQLQEEAVQRVMNWRSGLPLWVPNAAATEDIKTNAIEKFGDLLSSPYGDCTPSASGHSAHT